VAPREPLTSRSGVGAGRESSGAVDLESSTTSARPRLRHVFRVTGVWSPTTLVTISTRIQSTGAHNDADASRYVRGLGTTALTGHGTLLSADSD
jgi:hypothetical protein